MTEQLLRTILYGRVSSSSQIDNYSLAQQLDALRAHARAKGYEVVAEIVDAGYSGTSLERPGLVRRADPRRKVRGDTPAHRERRIRRALHHGGRGGGDTGGPGATGYPHEQSVLARIEGSRLIPMAEIFDHLPDLDPQAEMVVVCHHGARSAYVTRILDRSGFESAYNLEGGLDAYSYVDASLPRY